MRNILMAAVCLGSLDWLQHVGQGIASFGDFMAWSDLTCQRQLPEPTFSSGEGTTDIC